MRIAFKLLIILLLVTSIRLISSCCSCEDDFFSFDYESLKIGNIDNSGQWSKPTEENVMSRASVAFEIQIIGKEIAESKFRPIHFSGFNTLSAQNCNCDERFISNQTISEIKIRTLNDINSDYCSNEDVTSLFLANTCLSCTDVGNFYITISELQKRLNPESIYHQPINKFLIYLTVPVENTKAQFEFEVLLSDGRSIIAQTALIEIKE